MALLLIGIINKAHEGLFSEAKQCFIREHVFLFFKTILEFDYRFTSGFAEYYSRAHILCAVYMFH